MNERTNATHPRDGGLGDEAGGGADAPQPQQPRQGSDAGSSGLLVGTRLAVRTKTTDGGSPTRSNPSSGGYDAFLHYSDDRTRMARLLGHEEEAGEAHEHAHRHLRREEEAAMEEDIRNEVDREGRRQQANVHQAANQEGRRQHVNDNQAANDRQEQDQDDGGHQEEANDDDGDEAMEEANDEAPVRKTRLSWEVHGNTQYSRWFRDDAP